MPNHLAHETSPYLLQHADNPVEWWPWSTAAFEEARRGGVPVLFSGGCRACRGGSELVNRVVGPAGHCRHHPARAEDPWRATRPASRGRADQSFRTPRSAKSFLAAASTE
uniref:DUF255 domain-containing protein n=1 Tax=Streptomyces sp. SID7805 TaxID=2690328 RepID=UPI001F039917|nr:DUF255 domain-containing protein [Streptomyces sp. SID7805]